MCPCHTESNDILGCIRSDARRLREISSPSAQHWWDHTWSPVSISKLLIIRVVDTLGISSLWEKGDTGTAYATEEKTWMVFFSAYKILRGGWKEDRARFIQMCPVTGLEAMGTSWIRGYSLWISGSTFSLNWRVTEPYRGCLREVENPSGNGPWQLNLGGLS